MATYKVQKGDNLSSIAKSLNIKGGWQELYGMNKDLIKNPSLIYSGWDLKYGQPTGTTAKPTAKATAAKTPGQEIGSTLAGTVEDPTKQNFIDKFGEDTDLRPDAAFQQFAAERINPGATRDARSAVSGYDAGMSRSGAWRTGKAMKGRQDLLNSLEVARKEAMNVFVQDQRNLFGTYYDQEMDSYMSAKNPSGYQLNKFGIELPGGGTQNMDMTNRTRYQYNPAVDFSRQFQYGGYGTPQRSYGNISPVAGTVGTSSNLFSQPPTRSVGPLPTGMVV